MKTFTLIVLALILTAGVLPAADPTPKDVARAKAALALASAHMPCDAAGRAAAPESPAKVAARAALKECGCEPCESICPQKCGCEGCKGVPCPGNDFFPRPMERPDAPKVTPVDPPAVTFTKVEPKKLTLYEALTKSVQGGTECFVYVGYNPPAGTPGPSHGLGDRPGRLRSSTNRRPQTLVDG